MALPQFWGNLIGIDASNSLGNFVASTRRGDRAALLVADFEGDARVVDDDRPVVVERRRLEEGVAIGAHAVREVKSRLRVAQR